MQLPFTSVKKSFNQMVKRKKYRYLVLGVAGLLGVVQFLLPPNVVVPRASLGTQSVGLQSRSGVERMATERAQTIQLNLEGKVRKFPAGQVGIQTDVAATMAQVPVINWTDRLIPFKPLYKVIKKHSIEPVVRIDGKKIEAFAAGLSTELKKEPVSAKAEIKDGTLVITKDTSGSTYAAQKIATVLRADDPISRHPYVVKPAAIRAEVVEKDLLPLKDELVRKTVQTLKVQFGTSSKTVTPDTYRHWLAVAQDPATKKWYLTFGDAALDGQLLVWGKEYNIAPGITQVSYYDDVETSRTTGPTGRALNSDAIKAQLRTWLDTPSTEPVNLATSVLSPRIVATRTYSRSSAQLQAKLNAWVASHSGKYQIAIRELGGRGREASYNVAQQTVMASTYKTFLAFVAYRQAETGALNLGTPMEGRNIEQCIEVMIVNSNNECAVALGRHIGWAKVDEIIAAAGFQGIRLNNYDAAGTINGDKLVNAQEQAKFLAQLSAGSLNNPDNTGKLLNYMKRQTYRSGIPAGSRGAPVADKVGFLDNYLHDVGIVYGAKSTYALVIMSQGSSWTNIRDLAQAVYDFMNE